MYNKVLRVLKQWVPKWSKSNKKLAIYPYGQQGKFIKDLLEDIYGITDVLLVDNGLAKLNDKKFHPIDALGENTLVFISSCSEKIYAEIRNEVCLRVPMPNICDVFS